MLRQFHGAALAALGAIAAIGIQTEAAAVTLDFETISPTHARLFTRVLAHYDGGAAGNGVVGPDYGVQFSSEAYVLCLNTPGVTCSGASAGPGQTANHFAMSLSRVQSSGMAFMNVPDGFWTALSFVYSLPFNGLADGAYVEIFSGLDGSGSSLGRLALSQTPLGTSACPGLGANYCPFAPAALSFSGMARSALFQAPVPLQGSGVVFDNIVFAPVPEPQVVALWLGGLVAVVFAARRRTGGCNLPPSIDCK